MSLNSKKIKAITQGSRIIDEIFWELFKLLRTRKGLTELDLARGIKRMARLRQGYGGQAFPPIVSFGSSSAEIHHKPSNKKIAKNNFLMLDYGIKVKGWCSDFTRTLFLGSPNKFQEKIYNTVLKAQLATIKKIAIGESSDKIDFTARHIINQSGFGKFFTHGTGHGVGRKIHEAPSFKINTNDKGARGDVVTVEPGIYLPRKFGVRIEDMILIANKPKIFSKVPKDFKSMIIH